MDVFNNVYHTCSIRVNILKLQEISIFNNYRNERKVTYH